MNTLELIKHEEIGATSMGGGNIWLHARVEKDGLTVGKIQKDITGYIAFTHPIVTNTICCPEKHYPTIEEAFEAAKEINLF